MKKRILLFTLAAGFGCLVFSSYSEGPAFYTGGGHYDCTGAESAGTGAFADPTGCAVSGISCHSTAATAGITVSIALDSAGTAITHYTPGKTYKVKITGTNTTGTTLPKYGFQLTALTGTTSIASPSDAGTFATTGLPANTRITGHTAGTQLTVAEHNIAIPISGTTFADSFSWTAPAIGTGSISFWGVANFVNGDGDADAADVWNTTHATIIETDPVSHVAVGNITKNISLTAFPNPVTEHLNIQIDNAQEGSYSLNVYDLNGRNVAVETIEVNSKSQITNINTGNWQPGLYQVVVEKDGSYHMASVVKM